MTRLRSPAPRWRRAAGVGLALAVLAGSAALGKVPGAADPYRARHTDPGTIRIWGNPAMGRLFGLWAAGYQRIHPDMHFEFRLVSTAMAMPGLYLGLADLALLGREPSVEDHDGFLHVRAYEPLRLEVATGSLATPGKSPALVAFVHPSNPLGRITLAQLDGAFGSEHRRGSRNLRTWGDLGLTGAWRDRPINLYLCDVTSGTGGYFIHAVLEDSHKLAWDRLTEADEPAILAALRADPNGLAVASLARAGSGVKPLDLAAAAGGPWYAPTEENLIARRYPLTRAALVFVDRLPGQPLDPKVAGFLRYLYGPEGQAELRREGAYLPLNPDLLREQAAQLR